MLHHSLGGPVISEKLNAALDIIAPKKEFTIRPNYVQGLSEKVKMLMRDRDQTRSQLRKQSMTYTEKKSLTMKYKKNTRTRASPIWGLVLLFSSVCPPSVI